MQKRDHDIRDVCFKKLHGDTKLDWQALLSAVDPKPGQKILDACCGYGEVSEKIIQINNKIFLFALDISLQQLNRLKTNLNKANLVQADIVKPCFRDNSFDCCVIKIGVHEIPLDQHNGLFNRIFRLLKPGGKLVVWDVAVEDKTMLEFFQKVIKRKDELAGFTEMSIQRSFFSSDYLTKLFYESGFVDIDTVHKATFIFETFKRKDELVSKERLSKNNSLSENSLNILAEASLSQLHDFIRTQVSQYPTKTRSSLDITDKGNTIILKVTKIIMVGHKPEDY